MKSWAVMLLFGSVAFALGACKQRFTNANLEVVNHEFERADDQGKHGERGTGVSTKQVESILGPPTRVEVKKLPLETQKKELELTRYYYVQDGEEIAVHFIDNKLISKVPLLGASKVTKGSETQP